MNYDDIKFKKYCQTAHFKLKSLLKNNKMVEAARLTDEIRKNVKAWGEYERSVRLRARLINNLSIEAERQNRIKLAQLKRLKAGGNQ